MKQINAKHGVRSNFSLKLTSKFKDHAIFSAQLRLLE